MSDQKLGYVLNPLARPSSRSRSPRGFIMAPDNRTHPAQKYPRRVVVGVVGGTGAGKSRVINAVLDKIKLSSRRTVCAPALQPSLRCLTRPPRALMKGTGPTSSFVGANKWARKLNILLDDIQSGQATFGAEAFGAEGGASIAYQKIRAVYPSLSGDDIKKGRFVVDDVMNNESVKELLGTERKSSCSSSTGFAKIFGSSVDAKDKARGLADMNTAHEFWPLIKVVRVLVWSEIVKPGLVLVGLPGIHGFNAARSAIASKYVEQCAGVRVKCAELQGDYKSVKIRLSEIDEEVGFLEIDIAHLKAAIQQAEGGVQNHIGLTIRRKPQKATCTGDCREVAQASSQA
ncbi:hypothetical protein QBC36DRAFT_311868 [Triangularia setosa]|uniref:Uncharacterized protein n=1 Tax=Triangularia setosa TaxID=2587417 RepID=A0AAN6W5W8_9PEZI|nr:hypothetical protein QBC36DRAFT_311868 [Podospora setosa]